MDLGLGSLVNQFLTRLARLQCFAVNLGHEGAPDKVGENGRVYDGDASRRDVVDDSVLGQGASATTHVLESLHGQNHGGYDEGQD